MFSPTPGAYAYAPYAPSGTSVIRRKFEEEEEHLFKIRRRTFRAELLAMKKNA